MLLNVYQEEAMSFDITRDFDPTTRALHMRSGSVEELGEMSGLDKRAIRDGVQPSREQVVKEFGDRLWYLVGEIDAAGLTLEEVASTNLRKLTGRSERGTIQGNGDNR